MAVAVSLPMAARISEVHPRSGNTQNGQLPENVEDNDTVEAYIDAELVSQYLFRGREQGGISIQPMGCVSWQGLTLKAWGSVGFDHKDAKDIRLTLGYEYGGFNIGVIDYWTTGIDPDNRFFHFEEKGAHRLEANIGYSWKYGTVQAYTIFWGNDYKSSGQKAYSTYLELSVPFSLGGIDWKATVGGTPFESAGTTKKMQRETADYGLEDYIMKDHLYAEGPACVMGSLRATRKAHIGNWTLPVFAEVSANPYLQTAHFLVGMTIAPF